VRRVYNLRQRFTFSNLVTKAGPTLEGLGRFCKHLVSKAGPGKTSPALPRTEEESWPSLPLKTTAPHYTPIFSLCNTYGAWLGT
jgi:hypothetical protein